MLRTFFSWVHKYERHLSAAAMVAGFIVDSLFFERVDLWQTQAVFAAYTAICFIAIPWYQWFETRAARGLTAPRWRFLLPIAVQFSLGGFWSGFVVFYGRAADFGASWPFLLFLFLVLLGNEYFAKYHARLVFTSVLFFFALYSYAIFAVPIFVGSIGTPVFLLSGLVAILAFAAFTTILRAFTRERFRAGVWRIRAGALIVLAVINLFYFTNLLPPLPLAAKAADVYHAVSRTASGYVAMEEAGTPWSVRYLGLSPTLHVKPGESLSVYSSVFAPTALTTTIAYRWKYYDETSGQWVQKAYVAYPISGGRDGGYRGYSTVSVSKAGKWQVSIETLDGRRIAQVPFTVVQTQTPPELAAVTLE